MAKKLDLNKTVYELTQEYPELIEIMAGLGFTEIIKKPMLHSVGKIMTIPKGAKMKNISMMDVVTTLIKTYLQFILTPCKPQTCRAFLCMHRRGFLRCIFLS